jgi:hypothetical protein
VGDVQVFGDEGMLGEYIVVEGDARERGKRGIGGGR